MVTLTDNIIKQFKSTLTENNAPAHGIRIFAAGGCCGPSFAMDIVETAEKEDIILKKDGVKIFLEKEANTLLSQATMDFSQKRGIIISGMPRSSCCG